MTELGNRLKVAREEKNISLEDLQKLTKIQKRYLVGIEEGNYDLMPGKFYVRAFIKQYCEAVGLSPDEIFEQYKSDIPVTQTEDLPQQLSRVRTRKEMPEQASKALDALPIILVVAVIIGIAVVVWVFAQSKATDNADENVSPQTEQSEIEEATDSPLSEEVVEEEEAQKEEEPVAEEEPTEEEEQPTATQQYKEVQKSGRNATYELTGAKEFKLEISAKDADTWLDVKNGKGGVFYNAGLKSGETKEFDLTQESEVRVNIGFSPAVQMKINGQDVQLPFNPSERVRQVITIQYKGENAQ
ncbi:helix-turn-helix domain-containing protein [Metabacillus iocasae]|uniref:Cytoskeletal protein RodZ n=1 Tax=Priestia iocasae TaxID=2291674 RepID=A0ABS2QR59_9BACI|nr:helix-turn-helix domain-containing protein [Metabacillus iocasae]MBM7701935.1 cytoskeletal protein RodZ [Metabacillus iocasae]